MPNSTVPAAAMLNPQIPDHSPAIQINHLRSSPLRESSMSKSGRSVMTRREVFNAATLTPIALLSSETGSMAALAAPDHPDAELLLMGSTLAAAQARRNEFYRLCDEVLERFTPPSIPIALVWRFSDRLCICSAKENRAQCKIDEVWHAFYEDGVADLSSWAQQYAEEGEAYRNDMFGPADRARTREIMVTHAAWLTDQRRAEDAAGITEFTAAADRESEIIDDLIALIIRTPAFTVKGIAAKAMAVNQTWYSSDPSWIEREYLPRLLSKEYDLGHHHLFAVSLMVDAMKLGEGRERGAR